MTTGVNPHWAPDPQRYAVDQERWRHDEALYSFGEYAMFVLLWRIGDHEEGRVGRCPTCYLARGKIAEVYQQPSQEKCPDCFGTTFEGGYKARIVRPMIFDSNDEEEDEGRRGVVVRATGTLQTTSDFEVVEDYMFRADGSRWQVEATTATQKLSTGFAHRTTVDASLGVTINAIREDESSVAYIIPPDEATVVAWLDRSHFHYPLDFSAIEHIRGPLL